MGKVARLAAWGLMLALAGAGVGLHDAWRRLAARAPLPSHARCAPTQAAFEPAAFAMPDGALTVFAQGDRVDPYFATKALLVAARAGLCIEPAAGAWVAWLLPRQRPDGNFARYCGSTGAWRECEQSDADDAMAAVWIELLATLAGREAWPAAWRDSAHRARRALAALENGQGTYDVSHGLQVALLMDNAEVLSALRALAAHEAAAGSPVAAWTAHLRATGLRRAIDRQFWDDCGQRYRPSSQALPQPVFYPHAVAQIYPVLAGFGRHPGGARAVMQRFVHDDGGEWIAGRADHYPWGLVATALLEADQPDAVVQWLPTADRLRGLGRWNILEEAALAGVRARLAG